MKKRVEGKKEEHAIIFSDGQPSHSEMKVGLVSMTSEL